MSTDPGLQKQFLIGFSKLYIYLCILCVLICDLLTCLSGREGLIVLTLQYTSSVIITLFHSNPLVVAN